MSNPTLTFQWEAEIRFSLRTALKSSKKARQMFLATSGPFRSSIQLNSKGLSLDANSRLKLGRRSEETHSSVASRASSAMELVLESPDYNN